MSPASSAGAPSGTYPRQARTTTPAGYVHYLTARGADVVALAPLARTVREALASGSLYAFAERRHAENAPGARRLEGRAPVYAVTLPDGETRVVVRHSRHGGLLAPLTGDRFVAPTRAPRELAVSQSLRASGVRTPEIVAYALYPAPPLLYRSDVATREVAGRDLGESLREGEGERAAMLEATGELLRSLTKAGARHPDLNVKNVLLAPAAGGGYEAWVLDVDRIRMRTPGDARITAGNVERLLRSARKWRTRHGVAITEAELEHLAALAGA